MHWLDWTIVFLAIAIPLCIGLLTKAYVKGVSDFLSSGRIAGRYVIAVSSGEAGMGLISLVAMFEQYYQSGFAYGFWGSIASPIMIILGLTGYCIYRFRETRAMTLGQFLEMRYSRRFRLFAGILQSISGIINYALFPAVGARFLVYVCGLPVDVTVGGFVFPTFALLMALFLGIAVLLATRGGMIAIMVVDCFQGILGYPMYLIITAFILLRFSWFHDIAPVMFDRPPGHSLLNPFDIGELRDFNLLFILIGLVSSIINRIGWSGGMAFSTAAKNAHEQKMAAVLGNWRNGFHYSMIVLMAIVGFAFLNGDRFQAGAKGAVACRTDLAVKAVQDVAKGENLAPVRQEVIEYLKTGTVTPELQAMLAKTEAIKAQEKIDREKIKYVVQEDAAKDTTVVAPNASEEKQKAREARIQVAKDAIRSVDPATSQTFGTIFGQMRVPMALRYLLPIGILGLFCALCIMGMMSCDISYMHSWGSILVQDIILPIHGKPLSPQRHLALLRWMIAFVALFAFFFSLFFGQVDFILMFFTITGAIWLGGSGPCLVGGLYWKRGTTAGAWTALLVGSGLAVTSLLVQKSWVGSIYPWLYEQHLVDTVAAGLAFASGPFEPIIKWRMSSEKFPINSQELYGLGMLLSIGSYIVVSLLTSREPFNMDRMLHRGKYQYEGAKLIKERLTWRNLVTKLIGIDNQYSRGDKVLAWSVFIWSFGWGFLCSFVGVVVWNFFSPWGNNGWSLWFFINNFVIAIVIGLVSTVWFTIGGIIDLRRLFKGLAAEKRNVLDDGRVIGHVSADDVELVERVDHAIIPEAHIEEVILHEKTEKE